MNPRPELGVSIDCGKRSEQILPYIAQANVLDHLRVEVALADYLLEDLEDQAIERGVLESTLDGLGERCSGCKSDDNIVGVLRGADIINAWLATGWIACEDQQDMK